MRRDAFLPTLGAIAFLTFLGIPISAQPQKIPLIVERVEIVPARNGLAPDVAVTVRNIGTDIIEAWGVAGEARYENGVTKPFGVSADAYEAMSLPESLRPPANRSKRLPSGGTATITTMVSTVPPMQATDAAAYPTFAVFENDTAVGDEPLIQHTFSQRRLSQRVWRLASETLKSALKQGVDLDQAAASTVAVLEGAGDDVNRSIAFSIIRRTLSSSNPNKLQQLQMEIDGRLAAADRHAERRR